jgi:hypothetical protein
MSGKVNATRGSIGGEKRSGHYRITVGRELGEKMKRGSDVSGEGVELDEVVDKVGLGAKVGGNKVCMERAKVAGMAGRRWQCGGGCRRRSRSWQGGTRHSESDLIRILRELNLIDLKNISHSKDRKRSG